MQPQQLFEYTNADGDIVERPVVGGNKWPIGPDGKRAAKPIPVGRDDVAEFHRTRGQADIPDAPQGREMRYRDPQDQNRNDAYARREQRRADRAAETAAYQQEIHALAKTAAEHGVTLDEKQILDGKRQTTPRERQRVLANLKRDIEAGANKPPADPSDQAAQDAYLRGNAINERGKVVSVQSIKNEEKRQENKTKAFEQVKNMAVDARAAKTNKAADAKDRANATADAPNVIKDKNGNVVGYSYRTKAADKDGNVTNPELAKKESQTAANAKVDEVSLTDAVRIGSQANAANRFTEQTGVKQPGSGDYKARVAEQSATDKKMDGYARVRDNLEATQDTRRMATTEKVNAQSTIASGKDAFAKPISLSGTTSPPANSPLTKHRMPIGSKTEIYSINTHQNNKPSEDLRQRDVNLAGTQQAPGKIEMNVGTNERPVVPLGHSTRKATTHAAATNAQDVLDSANANLRTPVKTHQATTSSIDGRRLRVRG